MAFPDGEQAFSPDSVRATYDAVAEPYAERFADELAGKPLDRALLGAFAEQVAAVDGDPSVADVGCGPGHVTRHLCDLGLRARGVDLSPRMVETARRHHPDIDFQEGSMLGLAVEDESWAGVLSFYSIIHLPPAAVPAAFREFHRVLRPGGSLLLAFHASMLGNPDRQIHVDEWFDRPVSIDGYFFDPDDIAAGLTAEGFAVEALVRRYPYTGVEIATQRAYVLARKPSI